MRQPRILNARVHEVCGSSAVSFAAAAIAQSAGPALWVRESWSRQRVNPNGLASFFDPSQLLIADVKDHKQALAVAEEGLRDGSVLFVVIELSKQLDLTAGRRLQLAARAGNSTGLCLIADGMGSAAAETRWHCSSVPDSYDSTLMKWELIKNKSGIMAAWQVRWDAKANCLCVVSKVSQ